MTIGDPIPQLTPEAEARVSRLRETVPALQEGIFWERRLYWAESHASTRGEPEPIRTAKAFANLLDNMTVEIGPDELIVGRHPKGEPPPEVVERIDEANRLWGGHGLHEWAAAQIPPDAWRMSEAGVFNTGSKTGHMTPDYAGLLGRGLGGIIEHIDTRLHRLWMSDPEVGEGRTFLLAAKIACEAATRFALRYAELAEGMQATETDPRRRDELGSIAGVCRQVSAGPARSFHEALQLSWFLHLWVCLENGEASGAFAPGRVDQYLCPSLVAGIDSGELSETHAYELLLCYWLKFNEICYMAIQSAVLGGVMVNGRDGTNRLTELCLAATHHLRTLEPALVLRVSKKTPRPVLRQAAELLRTGMGLPQLYNDDVAVACIERAGCLDRDAREYCIGGCVELTVQGMSDPWVGNFFNLPACLLLALNEGACPMSGASIGAATAPADAIGSFDELLRAYRAQVRFCLERMVCAENVFDRAQAHCTPYPFLSANILDCIENARDITSGGARYNFTELQGVGIANVADSLAAIRKFVFEEKRISLPELAAVLRADYEGSETLRVELLNDTPKYGNGDGRVDELARFVVETFVAEVEKYDNPRGGKFRAGLLVWDRGDVMGQSTGATPDGRRAGTVLADCIGPAQGRDRNGPTSVVHSVTTFDHTPIVGGLVLNLKFLPGALAGTDGAEKFIDLLTTYFGMGGMQMQVNVVDDETLRRAQKEPGQYQNLVVRVSGWSARFLRLPDRLQEEIIARTAQEL